MVEPALERAVLIRPDLDQAHADAGSDGGADQWAALVPGLVVEAMALAAVNVQVDRQTFGDVVAVADVVPGVEVGRVEADEIDAAADWGLEAG